MSEASKPKSNRGGKRTGAGRKKKGYVSPSVLDDLDLRAALIGDAPQTLESEAQRHARTAIEALIKIITAGGSEAARIAACNTVLDRGYGKPTVETGVDLVLPFFGVAPSKTVSGEIREQARRFARLAIETLNRIATAGKSEASRVTAAKSLLDRGLGTVGAARIPGTEAAGSKFGKKELADVAAANAGVGTEWGDDLHIAARRAN